MARSSVTGFNCCTSSAEVIPAAADAWPSTDDVVDAGNSQASDGAHVLTISFASSPCDCHANVPPTPIRTAVIQRKRARTMRLPVDRFLFVNGSVFGLGGRVTRGHSVTTSRSWY